MMLTIKQAALAATRIRAINDYGPRVGEYTPGVGDIKATFARVRARIDQQNLAARARAIPLDAMRAVRAAKPNTRGGE
jgi:hypothetical protein